MKIFDIFARGEKKESRTAATVVLNGGQAVWSNRDYKAFAAEGYQKNVIAYQSINKVAEAVASIEWEVWKGDKQLSESPLLDLLAKPNPMQSGQVFMTNKVAYLMIAGNAYDEQVTVGGTPRELYTLRPDRMKITPSRFGFPLSYTYELNGRKVVFEVDPNTLESDINHTKLFNPLDDWYGMAPIEAGAYAVDQHNESMTWIQSLLQNSARPSGALVTSDKEILGEEAFNRLKKQTDEQYSGARNAGRPMLLEGGLKWEQMGLSPADMSILETKYSAARDISLAYGVPPQLLGIKGDNTYANYAEARLAFWEDTALPLVKFIGADLTNWLGPQFGDVELRANFDKVPAIVDKRSTLWKMADNSDDLTINERRELKGYEPIDGGDVIMVSALQAPLGDTGDDFSGIDEKSLARIAGYDNKAG